jgi:hypothetical protein
MKRASIVLLCIVFLFNCAGWQCIFFYLQNELHEANWNETIEDETLVAIPSASDITFVNPHEISLQGRLYDIIKVERTTSGTVYTCKQDEKEEALLSTLTHESFSPTKDRTSGERTLILKTHFEFLLPDRVFIEHQKQEFAIMPNDVPALKTLLKPPFSPPEV